MNFGQTLREIRLKNKDSLRSLGDKAGVFFTYIDKVEKGVNSINKSLLEKLINVYPMDKKILINTYIKEMLPINADLTDENNDIEYIYFKFLKDLDLEDRKNIYYSIIEKIELSNFKNGSYEEKKKEIEKARIFISKLR